MILLIYVVLHVMISANFGDKVASIYTNIAANRPPCSPLVQHLYQGPKIVLFQPVTPTEVSKLIQTMPLSACTLDFVPPSIIKSYCHIFTPIITRLANLSLSTGVFPNSFKVA